jgi:thioredoxin 1
MRRLASILVPGLLVVSLARAAELPYDDHANAAQDIQRALHAAQAEHKDVLLVFGANWCPDCLVLDSTLHDQAAAALGNRFVIVKIDVGNFDKNLDLAKRYQVPLRKGIPAAAVVSPADALLYVTQGGELANARHMGEPAIVDLFSHAVADAMPAGRSASPRSP